MTGEVSDTLTAYNDVVAGQLKSVRTGTTEHAEDTTEMLNKLDELISMAESEALDYMRTITEDPESTVNKLHVALEDCERFLKDVDYFNRTVLPRRGTE